MYTGTREQSHPGNVYYVLVCRVALGHYVRTRDKAPGCKSIDGGGGGPVFAVDNARELANVPGVTPPVHYHALLADVRAAGRSSCSTRSRSTRSTCWRTSASRAGRGRFDGVGLVNCTLHY